MNKRPYGSLFNEIWDQTMCKLDDKVRYKLIWELSDEVYDSIQDVWMPIKESMQ